MVRGAHKTYLVRYRTRIGSAARAFEQAFHEARTDRSTIYRDKGTIRAFALCVKPASHHLLSRSRFAANQDGNRRARSEIQKTFRFVHRFSSNRVNIHILHNAFRVKKSTNDCYFLQKLLFLQKGYSNGRSHCLQIWRSSVAEAKQFQKVRAIIEADSRRKVVVVSAPGKRNPKETKLTDLLYTTYDLASKGLDFSTPWNMIRDRYLDIARDLGLETKIGDDLAELEARLKANDGTVTIDFLVSAENFSAHG